MTNNKKYYNLAGRFHEQVQAMPDAPALWVDGHTYHYSELGELTRRVAGWLKQQGIEPGSRIGIIAGRGVTALTGILGTCWAGCVWVPFNPAHPRDRLRTLLQRAAVDALIVDQAGAALLTSLEPTIPVFGPETAPTEPEHQPPVPCKGDDLAYLMFTSGTTGVPKGVMITHAAIDHFLSVMQARYSIRPGDRVSQFFELTFDLSVFDVFMSLGNGATLCLLPEASRLGPAAFIKVQQLTVWFSVPSAMVLMDRFRQLKPAAFPDLRLSLFCGEPLPADSVESWMAAAPGSLVENLYGPTEATLACLLQPCSSDIRVTAERGCVAIGQPYPEMEVAIMDLEKQILMSGDKPGELMLAGPQLAAGYWRDSELTDDRFIMLDGKRWYRSGDLARQDADGCIHHLGRTDNQVKIMGHRVELEDIETHLRHACRSESAMTVAWPVNHGSAQGLVAFVAGSDLSVSEIRDAMKKRVPDYMIPRQIRFIDALPLTGNGKFDRHALVDLLQTKKRSPVSM
jgi:D-alanine--poly(phosphoribitol) ligase subunit 1